MIPIKPETYAGIAVPEFRPKTIQDIVEIVVSYFKGTDTDKILSRSRLREHAIPRQLIHTMVRLAYPEKSYRTIGIETGSRNHATVLNSLKVIRNLTETDSMNKVLFNRVALACGVLHKFQEFTTQNQEEQK